MIPYREGCTRPARHCLQGMAGGSGGVCWLVFANTPQALRVLPLSRGELLDKSAKMCYIHILNSVKN